MPTKYESEKAGRRENRDGKLCYPSLGRGLRRRKDCKRKEKIARVKAVQSTNAKNRARSI